jgi:hypothetical protein
MNLYLASENYASFIVDAPISYMHGGAFVNASFNKATNITSAFTKLFIDVSVVESGLDLVSGLNVTVNTTSNEFGFSLSKLTPRLEPYQIVITGASGDGAQFYTSTTELFYIPERTDGGSVAKVDNLYGGLLVRDYLTNSTEWTALFPYTFYTSWDGWLELSLDSKFPYTFSILNESCKLISVQILRFSRTTVSARFLELLRKLMTKPGYNIIHIVPNAGLDNKAFDFDELDSFLDIMDEIGLWLMFDMSKFSYLEPECLDLH